MTEPAVTIMVASHKPYPMPDDAIYLPLQVGAAGNETIPGFTRDDTGDNISDKNDMYCELTGLYWGWRNLTDTDYIGLVHYRRLFRGRNGAITGKEVLKTLETHRIIVTSKRRYFIETLYSHYVHTHAAEEIDKTRDIVKWMYPSYIGDYDKVMERTWGYMFNMFVMPKDMADRYCSWLFSILDELTAAIGTEERSDFDRRYPGRIGELLFNCWLEHQLDSGIITRRNICEIPFMYTEKVNHIEKAWGFLRAKYGGVKQEKSI